MKDINGAEVTITKTPSAPPKLHPLKVDWDAADTDTKKLTVLAKALGIV